MVTYRVQYTYSLSLMEKYCATYSLLQKGWQSPRIFIESGNLEIRSKSSLDQLMRPEPDLDRGTCWHVTLLVVFNIQSKHQ